MKKIRIVATVLAVLAVGGGAAVAYYHRDAIGKYVNNSINGIKNVYESIVNGEFLPNFNLDAFSEGLEYILNEDGKSYSVSGIGTCEDENVVIPATYENLPVIEIASQAFANCANLVSVKIPETITSIGEGAFELCENLKNVDIGKGVTEIGNAAFKLCENLASIEIPDNVLSLGEEAFSTCSKLASVNIGEGVKEIGKAAFEFCGSLKNIKIPDSVTSLGEKAFSACSKLESVDIGKGVEEIGDAAFELCESLKNVVIGEGLNSIGENVFADCSNLTNVFYQGTPEQWAEIVVDTSNALLNTVDKYYVSETKPSINEDGTSYNGNYWYYDENGEINVWDEEEFYNEDLKYTLNADGKSYSVTGIGTCKDTNVVVPSTYEGKPVTAIGARAFYSSDDLTSIVIPDSVTLIGEGAFYECESLTSVILPNSIALIDEATFGYCTNLTSIDIPDKVTSIGVGAFLGSGLTSVEIPDSVKLIDGIAFYGCANLKSVVISNGVTTIGGEAFHFCANLTSVYYYGTREELQEVDIAGVNDALASATVYYYSETQPTEEGNYWHYNENGEPTVWGIEEPEETGSKGLSYTLLDDGTYEVSGIGTCTDTEIIISPKYKGKPVTSIGICAFEDCVNLTSIIIPDSVTSIGSWAFYYCFNLEKIEIPDSVTDIGSHAFNNCTSLTSVELPSGITGICDHLFFACVSLVNVTIPESVTYINNGAFDNCVSLTSIVISENVTFIGDAVFSDCSSLMNITVDENNANYKSIDGALYTKNGQKLIGYAGGKNDASFTVLDGVTSIGEKVFWNCYSLTSLVVSESLTTIGEYAFANCSNLTSIYYKGTAEEWTGISISSSGNSYLTSATVYYYSETESTEEGNYWHYDENGEVVVWEIKEPEETGSKGLSYTLLDDGTYEVSGIGTCEDTEIVIPSTHEGKAVTSICSGAFFECDSLISIKIPNSITFIDDAFTWCSNLKNVTISDSVTMINGETFYECNGLTNIIIGNNVTSIRLAAFWHCYNLTSVYYKGTAEEWEDISIDSRNEDLIEATRYYYSETQPMEEGNYWHYNENGEVIVWEIKEPEETGSKGLSYTLIDDGTYEVSGIGTCEDTEIVIPSTYEGKAVSSIGDNAFYNCDSLTSVVIGNGITSIGDWAFYQCMRLTSVELPDSVTLVGDYAFYNCIILRSLIIGEKVTMIGEAAFSWCRELTSVKIPASVSSIGHEAFVFCNLTNITVDENNEYYKSIDGNLYTKDGKTLIQYAVSKTDESFTIPDSVTEIGDFAFNECSSLKGLEIPNGVTSIGSCAFQCCGLISIEIPDSVITISDYAFNCCASLSSVIIPEGVKEIGEGVFTSCNSLTSVTIPDRVTTIGDYAFSSCIRLTSVEIGDSVTSIGECAFAWCDSLTSITVDENNQYYKSIDGNLYTKDGKKLIQYAIGKTDTSFTIPDSVTSIGDYAFAYCDSLTSVVIPDSVTTIGEYAFAWCTSLTSVYYKGTAEEWGAISIGSSNTPLTNATRYYYSETQSTEEGNYWHYDENGEVVVW